MLIDWTAIRLLYVNELRSALRERAVIVNAVLVPLLMYPLIMWAGFSAFLYIAARTESLESRVEVAGLPAEHRALADRVGEDDSVSLVERDLRTTPPQADLTAELLQRIRSEELDAALVFGSAAGDAAGNLEVTILSDTSQDRSRTAHGRLERAISEYRTDWLDRIADEHGLSSAAWQVIDVRGENLATGRQMGQFLLGLLIPLFFIIMIAGGCLYPAIDSTAGERERNTWETTCTLATGRLSVVAAKYLYVITMGAVAGILNVGAMVVSFRSLLTPFLARIGNGGAAGFDLNLPLSSLPLLFLFAVLAASLIGAALMILAAFARTIKEGQGLLAPLYLALVLPIAFLNDPGLEFTAGLALIPIVNIVLLLREAIGGSFPWLQVVLTFLSTTTAIALCLWLASFVLRMEEVITGGFGGSPYQFLSRKLGLSRGST